MTISNKSNIKFEKFNKRQANESMILAKIKLPFKESEEYKVSDLLKLMEELERVLDLYRNWNKFPYHFNEKTITAIEHALISNKGLLKKVKKLQHKIEQQNALIDTLTHNEETYELLVNTLEKNNLNLKKDKEKIINSIYKLLEEIKDK